MCDLKRPVRGKVKLVPGHDSPSGWTDTIAEAFLDPDGLGLQPRTVLGAATRPAWYYYKRCALTSDGRAVVTAGESGDVKVWDAGTGLLLQQHDFPSEVCTLCATGPDLFAAGLKTGELVLRKLYSAGQHLEFAEAHADEVCCTRAAEGYDSSGDTLLVSGSDDKLVKVWRCSTGELVQTFKKHGGKVHDVAVSEDGLLVVSTAREAPLLSSLFVWRVEDGAVVHELKGPHKHWDRAYSLSAHTDGAFSCHLSSCGRMVLTGGSGSTKVFDTQYGGELLTLKGHDDRISVCLVLGEDFGPIAKAPVQQQQLRIPDRYLTFCTDGTFKLWRLSAQPVQGCLQHPNAVNAVKLSQDASLVATVTSQEGGLRVFLRSSGKLLCHIKAHDKSANDVLLLGDVLYNPLVGSLAGTAITCSNDATVRVWNLASGSSIQTLAVHADWVNTLAITADTTLLLSGSSDRTLKLTDMQTGEVDMVYTGHTGGVFGCRLSQDETRVLSLSFDKTMIMWDKAKGKELLCLHGHTKSVLSASYISDDLAVSAGRDGTVRLWDLEEGLELPCGIDTGKDIISLALLPVRCRDRWHCTVLVSNSAGDVLEVEVAYRQPHHLKVRDTIAMYEGHPTNAVSQLLSDFPGIAAVPLPSGRSLLHELAEEGNHVVLQRVLAKGTTVGPFVVDTATGETAVDVALRGGHRRCTEYLLAHELRKPIQHRSAVLKAWPQLARNHPALLGTYLRVLGLEFADPKVGRGAEFAYLGSLHLLAKGSMELAHEQLWKQDVETQRESRGTTSGETRMAAMVCGVPHIADAGANLQDSPLGLCVLHNLRDCVATDIMCAVMEYKWTAFAGRAFWMQSVLHAVFLAAFVAATAGSVHRRSFPATAGTAQPTTVGRLYNFPEDTWRVLAELVVVVMNLWYLWGEASQIVALGLTTYLGLAGAVWNWIDLVTCFLILASMALRASPAVCMQHTCHRVADREEERVLLGLTAIALGLKTLKVARGLERTGPLVRMLLRVLVDIRFFLAILVVIMMAFCHAMFIVFNGTAVLVMPVDPSTATTSDGSATSSTASGGARLDYLLQRGITYDNDYSGYARSMITAYRLMIGDYDFAALEHSRFFYFGWLLYVAFTFLVTIIMLNLLIAIMSDSYAVVKEHARSGWLLERARIITEIEQGMPRRLLQGPPYKVKWLHVLTPTEETDGGEHALLQAATKVVARQALNTDIMKARAEISEQVSVLETAAVGQGAAIEKLQNDLVALRLDLKSMHKELLAAATGEGMVLGNRSSAPGVTRGTKDEGTAGGARAVARL
ncbi:WD repeat domain-containing protein [Tetrabaena socialis]|uniref:WD repeat domain-containing protein n=1 Tax=Tetrabaena socialis TaxID=47790 RepID=A0A2J7ZYB9_9CHLO|nr:WD repeat domain-containing protein [Tetrabaena socialis]|eukprot:PNH05258.1 WD repeat domain-containing protein [Tetrabaena socialis]